MIIKVSLKNQNIKANIKTAVALPIPKKVDELPTKAPNGYVYEKDGYLYQCIERIGGLYLEQDQAHDIIFIKDNIIKCMNELKEIGYDNAEFYKSFYDNVNEIFYTITDHNGTLICKKEQLNYETEEFELLDEFVIYENGKWYKDGLHFDTDVMDDETCFPNNEYDIFKYYAYLILPNYEQRPSYLDCLTKAFFTSNSDIKPVAYDEENETYRLDSLFDYIDFDNISRLEEINPIPFGVQFNKISLKGTFSNSTITNEIFNTLLSDAKEKDIIDIGSCFSYANIDEIDFSNFNCVPVNATNAFVGSTIKKIKGLNLINCEKLTGVFSDCNNLTELEIFNNDCYLQLHESPLLTLDSIIHTIKELIKSEAVKRLQLGTINLNKIANVYVRITNENDPKLSCEVCGSTDEGAMLISNYVTLKGWSLA